VDAIEDFVRRIPGWMDETGAGGDPDLDLIRDLLEARAAVLEPLDLPVDEWKIPACFVWPNQYLWRTVLEVAPFKLHLDAEVREALIRTVPLLGGFIRMRCTVETDSTIDTEAEDVVRILRSPAAGELETPWAWALKLRTRDPKVKAVELPEGEPGMTWNARFGQLPWERRDELIGPMPRSLVDLPDKWWEEAPPSPVLTLRSSLVAAARQAPLMAAVVEVAEFLADRPGVWTGSRLADDVVQQVLDGTTITDASAVQEAWRLAVLAGFLWPTPERAFRGEGLDLWADPDRVVDRWTEVARVMVRDLPDPVRDEVVRLIIAAYSPGIDDTAAVFASADGQQAVDGLRRLGVLDGLTLTPLGRQGLLFACTGWKRDEALRLAAGEWRADLTVGDLCEWLQARLRGVLDPAGPEWTVTADPQALAGQLVDTMLAVDDGVIRATALTVLAQLGSAVTPVVDRLAGTRLRAYPAMLPGGAARYEPSREDLQLYLTDYLAFFDTYRAAIDKELQPGMRATTGAIELLGTAAESLPVRLREGEPMSAGDVAELRRLFDETRSEASEFLAELSNEPLPSGEGELPDQGDGA
jgi:hypothetical protein